MTRGGACPSFRFPKAEKQNAGRKRYEETALSPFHGVGTTPETKPKITAGWSSPVARQAHNLKVVGSNPTPATKY